MSRAVIPVAGINLREAVASEFSDVAKLVRNALRPVICPNEPNCYLDIEAMFPDRVVVCRDGRYFSYPYTINEQNQVTFGAPIEVVETFAAVGKGAAAAPAAGDGDAGGAAAVFVEAVGGPESGKWLIRVIQAGTSLNGVFYSDTLLRESTPMFNGARVFIKSDEEHIKGDGKAVDNLIGRLAEAKFVAGATTDTGEVQAVLSLIEPDGSVAVKIREAAARGMSDLFGFSIDADGVSKTQMREGRKVKVATRITKVSSVDLIVEPGAGGRLIRMVEAVNSNEEDHMRQMLLEKIKQASPALHAKLGADATDAEIETAYREAVAGKPAGSTERIAGRDDVDERIRMVEARANMRTTIATCNLPQPAKDKLLADFNGRERFVEADVTAAIEAERGYLARFTESGHVALPFGSGAQVEDRSVKIADMLDAFFDPAHKDHRAASSFKECYIQVTGDRLVTGRLSDCDRSRLREAAGANFREAVDSTSFSQVLGDAVTRRMLAIYTGMTDLQSWRKVAQVGRVSDFRTQHVGRIGGYGNLSIVGQGDPYPAMATPGDDEATWAVKKRGGTEDVTLEAIKNDDVRAIANIPRELALAAGNTLYEFVFDFYRTNPVSADGVALYHADHGNLFTGALDAAAFKAHRLAMQKMTRSGSGKRLATSPGQILVPFDLQDTAFDLFVRGTNNDKTFQQTLNPEIITVDYWTDATDWVTVAPQDKIPVLGIDFLDGREEPELFVQDNPSVGSMFTNDKLTYKIRHVYGGDLMVDAHKGTTKAVVA
jgi:hypothetical protein